MNTQAADLLAYVAHKAAKQYRADGKTPYIVHPRRVAELVYKFEGLLRASDNGEWDHLVEEGYTDRQVAALLHDVVEDTGITLHDLADLGLSENQVHLVDLLTKKNPNKPAPPEYYARIDTCPDAWLIKCADRCANLEDAIENTKAGFRVSRWAKYARKTAHSVLPLYEKCPPLYKELDQRLKRLVDAVQAQYAKRGLTFSLKRA